MAPPLIRVVACCTCVPAGYIPTTRVAHIPVVVVLDHVGKSWFVVGVGASSSVEWWNGTSCCWPVHMELGQWLGRGIGCCGGCCPVSSGYVHVVAGIGVLLR